METRSVDVMKRLDPHGGAGGIVVQGHVNVVSTVAVDGRPAQMRADPVTGGCIFRLHRPGPPRGTTPSR